MNGVSPKISIVVPVYNVQEYLIRCLDSIFSQEFTGTYEVIAVDDASIDNSLHILKTYQKKESRLKIIAHKDNKKLSMARASGMRVSSGEYIMHVDSDDWLLPNTLENLFAKCNETNADVIVFNYLRVNIEGRQTPVKGIQSELITTDKHKVQKYFFSTCWNKIVKRNLTENMIYGRVGVNSSEDLLYCMEILLRARTIYLLPECYYVYFGNRQSITGVENHELFLQNLGITFCQIEIIISENETDRQLTESLLNYLEKWIHLTIAKMQFGKKEKISKIKNAISHFLLHPIMTKTRVRNLELSMNNKFYSLMEVTRRFGLRTTIGIIVRFVRLLFIPKIKGFRFSNVNSSKTGT